jgi:MoaA/NifB/PqqE/SkfB family radical SAM enzyme
LQMNVTQLWNSKSIEPLRKNILDYNLSGGCELCNIKLKSHNFSSYDGRLFDQHGFSQKNQNLPTEMTLEISNTCNLECIMCTGTYSSSIRKNREKLPPLQEQYGDEFIDSIKESLLHLKTIRLLGGEPFLIPQYYEIIEYLIAHNPSCRILIQTNGSVLNNRVKKIIEHKNVQLSISIDALEKNLYEQIRKNASFDKLMEHMEYFRERAKKYMQVININFCVMSNNWQEVPSMLAYCNESNFTVTFIPVITPKELSIRDLSSAKLSEILSFYEAYESKAGQLNRGKFLDLVSYVKYCLEQSQFFKNKVVTLAQRDLDYLNLRMKGIFSNNIFAKADAEFALMCIKEYADTLNTNDQRFFLAAVITDIEGYYELMIKNYSDNQQWQTEFTDYFKGLKTQFINSIH